jgi:hypothetical protein
MLYALQEESRLHSFLRPLAVARGANSRYWGHGSAGLLRFFQQLDEGTFKAIQLLAIDDTWQALQPIWCAEPREFAEAIGVRGFAGEVLQLIDETSGLPLHQRALAVLALVGGLNPEP